MEVKNQRKRKNDQEPVSVEAKQLQHEAEVKERAAEVKANNKDVEEYYEIRPGNKPQDKKVVKVIRKSNGTKYTEFICSAKTDRYGKKNDGHEYIRMLKEAAAKGEVKLLGA